MSDRAHPALGDEKKQSHLSAVNDEIQVGFDLHFEQRWWRFERIAWIAMALFLILGLSGLLGRGPLTKAEAGAPGTPLRIQYERVVHFRSPSKITLRLAPPLTKPGAVFVHVGPTLLREIRIKDVLPRPSAWMPSGDGMVMEIPIPPGTNVAEVNLALEAGSIGLFPVELGVAGQLPVRFRQLVVP